MHDLRVHRRQHLRGHQRRRPTVQQRKARQLNSGCPRARRVIPAVVVGLGAVAQHRVRVFGQLAHQLLRLAVGRARRRGQCTRQQRARKDRVLHLHVLDQLAQPRVRRSVDDVRPDRLQLANDRERCNGVARRAARHRVHEPLERRRVPPQQFVIRHKRVLAVEVRLDRARKRSAAVRRLLGDEPVRCADKLEREQDQRRGRRRGRGTGSTTSGGSGGSRRRAKRAVARCLQVGEHGPGDCTYCVKRAVDVGLGQPCERRREDERHRRRVRPQDLLRSKMRRCLVHKDEARERCEAVERQHGDELRKRPRGATLDGRARAA
eukprot:Unigene6649_Nuclearia_a/m.20418 Unigene6649_Nuclearia_a/g.20418  ORF Unigene6649_Nuclearia_a/g.20418 Unigene6649_Nuclearia_a/m.20418 type:complete len:321 (-) Unigene6649_Nuclearia_a:2459-3421(-)